MINFKLSPKSVIIFIIFLTTVLYSNIFLNPLNFWCIDNSENQLYCVSYNLKFSRDLDIYINHYQNGVNYDKYKYNGILIYLIFDFFNDWLDFSSFLILFNFAFYSIIFFCIKKIILDSSIIKLLLIFFIITFFPFYIAYSTFGLKQGLGLMFLFLNFFYLKKMLSIKGIILMIGSLLSHNIFFLVYSVIFLSTFLNIKLIKVIFFSSFLIYLTNFNNLIYIFIIKLFDKLNLLFLSSRFDNLDFTNHYDYLIVSFLPYLLTLNKHVRNVFNSNIKYKKILKFCLLYTAIVFIFFSPYKYFNRIIDVAWCLYPFLLIIVLNLFKIKILLNKNKISLHILNINRFTK